MDQERQEKLLKRKQELFAPIEQQIMMSDDKNDLLLLAHNMYSTSCRIFLDEFGEKDAKDLADQLFSQTIIPHQ
jgi:hypothetical protein